MRAVERAPWAERRSSRHDEICALVAASPERAFTGPTGPCRAEIEAEVGRGFVDVLVTEEAPDGESRQCIVEVKTIAESASGGDIIRQMKWYRRELWGGGILGDLERIHMVLVLETGCSLPSSALDLIAHENIEILPECYFRGERTCHCSRRPEGT